MKVTVQRLAGRGSREAGTGPYEKNGYNADLSAGQDDVMAGRYQPIPGASPQLMDLLSKMSLGDLRCRLGSWAVKTCKHDPSSVLLGGFWRIELLTSLGVTCSGGASP